MRGSRGFQLLSMLIAIVLLSSFLTLSASLFRSSIRVIQQTQQIEARQAAWQHASRRLENDVWQATLLEEVDDGIHLVLPNETHVLWAFDGTTSHLVRSVESKGLNDREEWAFEGPVIRLGVRHGAVVARSQKDSPGVWFWNHTTVFRGGK
jgi:hypothetical protein